MALSPHLKALALNKSFKRTAQPVAATSLKEENLSNPPAALATTGFPYADTPTELIKRGNTPIGFRFRRRGCGFTILIDDNYDIQCFSSHQFTPEGGFFQANMTPEDYKYAKKVGELELSPADLKSLAVKLDIADNHRLTDVYEKCAPTVKPLGPQTTSFEFSENGSEYIITFFSAAAGHIPAPFFAMNYYCNKGHSASRLLNLHEQERAINRLSILMTLNQSIQYAETIQSLREHVANTKAKSARPEVKKFTISPIKPEGVCFELNSGGVSYTLTAFHPSVGRKPSFVMSCVDGTGNLLPIPLSTDEKKSAIDRIVSAMTFDQHIQYATAITTLRESLYAANDVPTANAAGRHASARSINFFG